MENVWPFPQHITGRHDWSTIYSSVHGHNVYIARTHAMEVLDHGASLVNRSPVLSYRCSKWTLLALHGLFLNFCVYIRLTTAGWCYTGGAEIRQMPCIPRRKKTIHRLNVEINYVERPNVELLNVERLNVEILNVERLNMELTAHRKEHNLFYIFRCKIK